VQIRKNWRISNSQKHYFYDDDEDIDDGHFNDNFAIYEKDDNVNFSYLLKTKGNM
jgi:hypothetical protein